ncbi:MAG: hypothetical protein KA154_05780 [Gemmatimonadaceae bacterium]|nr:hypothetical protein [Gemmatimonadaceae bacterium]MCC6241587.1 DUF2191 domain-containing protein [Gemmatimonadaceae bacterium]
MRTTIDIDDSLLQRLRDDAHRLGIPFRAMLHRVLQRGLDAGSASAPPQYRTPSVKLGQVREGVNLVKSLQLSAALEDEERAQKLRDGK